MFEWDSPLMQVLRTITDYIFVTVLMIVCSLPLVTAGAAFCAGYDTVRRYLVNEEGNHTAGVFFKSFVRNFKPATAVWLICGSVLVLFWQGLRVMDALCLGGAAPAALQGILILGMILCGATLLCALSSAARFSNTVGMLLKNGLLLSLGNLGRILVLMAVWAAEAAAVAVFRPLVLITPALAVFYWYRCMEKVFAPHLNDAIHGNAEK